MRAPLRQGVEGALSRRMTRSHQQTQPLRGKGKLSTRCRAHLRAFWMSSPNHAVLLDEGELEYRPKKNARGEVARNASGGLAR